MKKNEKRWYWQYTGEEFDFAEGFAPFATARYIHSWERPEELPMHRHGFTEIVLVLNGYAKHMIRLVTGELVTHPVERGDVLVINPQEEHTYSLVQGKELEIINIDFIPEFLDNVFGDEEKELCLRDFIYQQPMLPPQIRFQRKIRLLESELSYMTIQEDAIEQEMRKKQVGYRLMIQHILGCMLLTISRRYLSSQEPMDSSAGNGKGMSYIVRVKGYIEYHYMEEISAAELAQIANCSTRHLTRQFKLLTGMTISEYIHMIRIAHAKQMLELTKERIGAIATMVGFNDIGYFNKLFRQHTGQTPRAYRQSRTQIIRDTQRTEE